MGRPSDAARLPDLLLGEPRLGQRVQHACLLGGLQPWAVVLAVFRDGAVEDGLEAERGADIVERSVELSPAQIAAERGVVGEARDLQ